MFPFSKSPNALSHCRSVSSKYVSVTQMVQQTIILNGDDAEASCESIEGRNDTKLPHPIN